MADDAFPSGEKRDEHGRFIVPPVSPGRPKGSRNKLGEAFLKALQEDFEAHGVQAIVDTRQKKPEVYVRVIAGLLPTEHRLTINDQFSEMTDDELAERVRVLTATLAPFLIDGVGGAEADAGGAQGETVAPIVH